jgi:hypothetical protein
LSVRDTTPTRAGPRGSGSSPAPWYLAACPRPCLGPAGAPRAPPTLAPLALTSSRSSPTSTWREGSVPLQLQLRRRRLSVRRGRWVRQRPPSRQRHRPGPHRLAARPPLARATAPPRAAFLRPARPTPPVGRSARRARSSTAGSPRGAARLARWRCATNGGWGASSGELPVFVTVASAAPTLAVADPATVGRTALWAGVDADASAL